MPLYDELLLTVKVTDEAPEGTVDLIVEYSNGDIDLLRMVSSLIRMPMLEALLPIQVHAIDPSQVLIDDKWVIQSGAAFRDASTDPTDEDPFRWVLPSGTAP